MSADNFTTWYDFCEAPDNDGQPFHITEGDPGGATVYGWTYGMWMRVAPFHGITGVTMDAFKRQTKASLMPLSRAQYWNRVQGDHLPPGFDIFWTDFQFGSGRATVELQQALGVAADGVVGTRETIPAILAQQGPALLDRFLAARIAYYDACGFRRRWPGLYRRAEACHALCLPLAGGPTPTPALAQAA